MQPGFWGALLSASFAKGQKERRMNIDPIPMAAK